MSYALGVDIGTTFSAAAVYRQGRAEMVSLGYHSPLVPSAVLITSTNETLVGDAALRRGQSEPERLARFFKRRIGDSVPMILGGSPLSSETLTARLLRAVVDRVVEQQGEPPAQVAVTRPANWGPFKQDRFDQAVRLADLTNVTVLTEPEAAALAYAAEQRIADGAVVAVYDLGGGTFDATVLRRTGDRFTMAGEPEGIERLGGIDFDAAVFEHVRQSLYGAIEALDEDDPVTLRSITRLRNECIEAKEALSSDTQVSIPVVLPGLNTEVRLTRSELEGMIRPSLDDSIASLRRAVVSAGVEPSEMDRVLLVGGSSRIPLVAQMVGSAFGRPVALDAHPKHAVALGAALVAGGEGIDGRAIGATAPAPPGLVPPLVTPAGGTSAAAASAAAAGSGASGSGVAADPAGASGGGSSGLVAGGLAAAGVAGVAAASASGGPSAPDGGGPAAPTPPPEVPAVAARAGGDQPAASPDAAPGDQPFAFSSGPAGPHATPRSADGSLPTAPPPPDTRPTEPAGPPSGDAWPTPPPGPGGAPSGDTWPTPPPGPTGPGGAPSGDSWPTPPPNGGGPASGDAWAPPVGPDAPTRIESGDGWSPAAAGAAASAAGPATDDTQVQSGDTWQTPEVSPSGPPSGDTWQTPGASPSGPPSGDDWAPRGYDEPGNGGGGRRVAAGLAAGGVVAGAGAAAAGASASPGTEAPAPPGSSGSWSSPGSGSYPPGGGPAAPAGGTDGGGGRKVLVGAAAAVAVIALGAGAVFALAGGGDDDDTGSDTTACSTPVDDTTGGSATDDSATDAGSDSGSASAAVPTDMSVSTRLDLPRGGDGVDTDDQGRLWVATLNESGGAVVRFDRPQDPNDPGKVEIPLAGYEGFQPLSIHFAFESIWVTLRDNAAGTGKLLRLDPDAASADDPAIDAPYSVPGPAVQVTSGSDYIWVVSQAPPGGVGHVSRIDPRTGEQIDREVDTPMGVVVDGERVGITHATNQLGEYDLNLEPVGEPVPVGARADEVAVAGGYVWTADRDAGTVSYVDPESGTVGSVPVGGNPAGLRAEGNAVWVTDTAEDPVGTGRLILIDVSTKQVVTQEDMGERPLGLTVDGTTVWVTLFNQNSPQVIRVDAS